jgi:hypothetical protein
MVSIFMKDVELKLICELKTLEGATGSKQSCSVFSAYCDQNRARADCAIIVRPSVAPKTTDAETGLEVREIIAILRVKFSAELIKKIKDPMETV